MPRKPPAQPQVVQAPVMVTAPAETAPQPEPAQQIVNYVQQDDVKRTAMKWLFSQESQTVMVFLLLVGGGLFLWFGIPAHTKQVQDREEKRTLSAEKKEAERLIDSQKNSGAIVERMERIVKYNVEARDKESKAHADVVKGLSDTFEKSAAKSEVQFEKALERNERNFRELVKPIK